MTKYKDMKGYLEVDLKRNLVKDFNNFKLMAYKLLKNPKGIISSKIKEEFIDLREVIIKLDFEVKKNIIKFTNIRTLDFLNEAALPNRDCYYYGIAFEVEGKDTVEHLMVRIEKIKYSKDYRILDMYRRYIQ